VDRAATTVGAALRQLGESPWRLLLFLLAFNAVANPYAGIAHDASVYSLQALNRATSGAFADDLFLKYGSQDRFSAFSVLVSPIVSTFGVRPSFFALYALSRVLFLWAVARLFRALFDDVRVGVAAALFVAAAPMWYGGMFVFRVNEPFFTPRLPACALTLLALEQLLRERAGKAVALLFAALLLHPLMAAGGFLVAGWQRLAGRRSVWWLAAGAFALGAVAAVLAASGMTIAGHAIPAIDDAWRDVIHRTAAYNYPAEWSVLDWWQTISELAVVASAAAFAWGESRVESRFLAAIAGAACVGLAITMVAGASRSALLLQVQPYRALWLVALLHGPAALALAVRLWRSGAGSRRVLAVVTVCYLLFDSRPAPGTLTVMAVVGVAAFLYELARYSRKSVTDAALPPALLSLAAGVGFASVVVPALFLVGKPERFGLENIRPLEHVRIVLNLIVPLAWCAVAYAAVVLLSRITWRTGAAALALVCVARDVCCAVFGCILPHMRLHCGAPAAGNV
jgi:hypothetical protein